MQMGIDYIGSGVGAMIVNERGEFLLALRGPAAKNESGCWEFPGGTVEFGEGKAAAVLREVEEELGVRVMIIAEMHGFDHFIPAHDDKPAEHWHTTTFLCELEPDHVPEIQEPHKCAQIGWFLLDALPSPLAITADKNVEVYHRHIGASKA